MIPLIDILATLPRYDKNNAWGKKGDIKKNHRFRFNQIVVEPSGLTQDMIDNSMVFAMYPYSQAYGYHSTCGILFDCVDRRYDNHA